MKKLYVMVMAVLAIMLMTSCAQKQEQEIQKDEPAVNEIVSERVFTYALGEESYTCVVTVMGDHDTMLAESDYITSLIELINDVYEYCVKNDADVSVPILDSIIIYRDYSNPDWSIYTDMCSVHAHMHDTGEELEWEGNLFESVRTEYTVVERDVTWTMG